MKKISIAVIVVFAGFALAGIGDAAVDRHVETVATVPSAKITPSDDASSLHDSRDSDETIADYQPASQLKLETVDRFAETKVAARSDVIEQQRYRAAATPNDPYAGQDWETQIGLPTARDEPLGDYTPKVAVIDGGFALNHEDLRDQWLRNDGESGPTATEAASILSCSDQSLPLDLSCNVVDDDFNGVIDDESGTTSRENQSLLNCSDQGLPLDKSCNLIDDDGNGLVDDHIGFDFVNYERSATTGEINSSGDGVSHGSLVSGVLGATNDNALGLAGVGSGVELLPIQVLDDEGYGYTISVADGIVYAVSRGVDIINLSLGSDSQDVYIEQAIDYATERGVVVIAAAGNDGCDCDFYPAAYKPVVSVGAGDDAGQLASFSNYGRELDIVAPGVNLITTSWSSADGTDLYEYASGTSLATPVVSGVLSRLVSYQPDASPIELKALLHESTDKSMLTIADNRNDSYGYGFLDAQRATQRITTPLANSQIVTFDLIRSGSSFGGEYQRQEVSAATEVYACQAGQKPATTVFKLTKSSKLAFTVSEQEAAAAQRAGFSATPLFDACILQAHDTPAAKRVINTAQELLNQRLKSSYN